MSQADLKRCIICNNSIISNRKWQKTCSKKCSYKMDLDNARKQSKIYRQNHIEERKQLAKEYWIKIRNIPQIKIKRKIYSKDYMISYYKTHKQKLCKMCYERKRLRLKNDEIFHIKELLRTRLRCAIKAKKQTKSKYSSKYGIDYNKIIKHLGECPGDIKDYHIDHIVPIYNFDFNDSEQIKLCFSPENHRWLKKEENLRRPYKCTEWEMSQLRNKCENA